MFFLRRKPPYSRICKRLHATILFLLSIIPLPDNQRTMQKPCQLRCGGNGRLCKQAPNPRLARARKSTPYTARPRRFFMGLQTNNDIVTIAERMLTINDLLQALEPLHKRLAGLEQGQDVLEKGLNRLEGK